MSLQHDYGSIREGAAIGAISPRRPLGIAGPDRASFLQGLLTNDVLSLAAGSGCYASWLTPNGRMLTDMHVLESGSMMLLDVPEQTAAATLERLEQFHFTEDIQLVSLETDLADIWIHGPAAPDVLERALGAPVGLATWRDYQHAPLELAGTPASVVRIDQLGVPGYCVYVAPAAMATCTGALEGTGAVVAAPEAIAAARIEAGYPVFGLDMTEDTIPLEAGIENRAISFDKGCYVGQEIIVRVLHRGGGRVAKKLVSLRSEVPLAGQMKIFSGDREIGHVTSAAESPRLGPIALAYVHRDFIAPGTAVEADACGRRTRATVADRPMVSGSP